MMVKTSYQFDKYFIWLILKYNYDKCTGDLEYRYGNYPQYEIASHGNTCIRILNDMLKIQLQQCASQYGISLKNDIFCCNFQEVR